MKKIDMNIIVVISLLIAFSGSASAEGVTGRTVTITNNPDGTSSLSGYYNVRYNPSTDVTVWVSAWNYSYLGWLIFQGRDATGKNFSCSVMKGSPDYDAALDIASNAGNGSQIMVSANTSGNCYNLVHRRSSNIID